MNRPSTEELRRCALKFKESTTESLDSLAPGWIGWPFTKLLEVIIDFFEKLEIEGCWPEAINKSIVHMIPKVTGGGGQ